MVSARHLRLTHTHKWVLALRALTGYRMHIIVCSVCPRKAQETGLPVTLSGVEGWTGGPPAAAGCGISSCRNTPFDCAQDDASGQGFRPTKLCALQPHASTALSMTLQGAKRKNAIYRHTPREYHIEHSRNTGADKDVCRPQTGREAQNQACL